MSVEQLQSSYSVRAEKRLPLTEAQREIWFASQLSDEASLAYHESIAVRLKGALNLGALRRALRLLVARHEALRTRISAAGDVQVILPTGDIELAVDEAGSAGAAAMANEAVEAWLGEKLNRPFNLVDGPLFRAAVRRSDAQMHVLGLFVHHVICDGWSLGVMMRELGALYGAELTGNAAKLEAAPLLSEHLEQPKSERDQQAAAAARDFWHKEFSGEIPIFELPADHPRKSDRKFVGAHATRILPADLTAGLKQLCTRAECTAFTALLAAFSVFVHRLSGVEDVVIGVPSAGQVMAGLSGLVGHFANLLPFRSRVSGNTPFSGYLRRVRESLTGAMEHWRYPFGSLLQHLKIPRDASRVPLAPVVFNTTGRHAAFEFGGLAAEMVSTPKPHVNFDLNFHFGVNGDRVTLGCYYSRELYEPATIERWFNHFETLLRGIVARPDCAVGDLPLLSNAERERLLREWNETALDYRRDATIHQLFEEQAQRSPDATAVVAGRERLTYAELDRRATQVACALSAHAVGPDSLVGIFLDRNAHLPAAMLGILKAGGGYVPLDPTYPAARLEFIVRDTEMKLIVTQRSLRDALPATYARVICIEDLSDLPASEKVSASATASNLAYVIYTSGSTGQPKGVCVEHRGVVALTAWARRQYRPDELDGVLFATRATFDVSVFESLVPLCLGGKIILADNILALPSLPAAAEVRLVSGVPSAVAELVRSNQLPATVRTVNVAGEPCPQTLVDALYARAHVERVIDVYGPTETTVYSTGSVRRSGGRATIGRPLPNERAYILDSRLQPVPVGVQGELFIGGAKLARGYLNRPELTHERFVASPFEPGERLYRTGDGARFMPDGSIEFLGRLDHQVKIRGYRIELGEIEAELLRVPGVNEAVLMARDDAPGGRQLVAYLVAASSDVTPSRLREALASRLPDYMVPAHFVVLTELPRTSSGKVDRRALPEPKETAGHNDCVAPRTTTEEIIADVWRSVLEIEKVSVRDNFFEVGGHSLLGAQVVTRINDLFSIELGLRHLFAAPTLESLASTVERAVIEEIHATAGAQPAEAIVDNLQPAKE